MISYGMLHKISLCMRVVSIITFGCSGVKKY